MPTATMTLFHNTASPFVRKVMLVLHETAQLDRVQLVDTQVAPIKPNAQLNTDNPAGKIPALRLADGSVLHDSRVICEYLDHQHSASASDARVWQRQRAAPSRGSKGSPLCWWSRYSQITLLSCSTLPSVRRNAGILPAGLSALSCALGLIGATWVSTSCT